MDGKDDDEMFEGGDFKNGMFQFGVAQRRQYNLDSIKSNQSIQ